MIDREFLQMIRDIIKSESFRAMKHYRHHIKGSVYDHSLKVAYLCYRHHKRHGTAVPCEELVRGALLHDFYGYDWHDRLPGHRLHLFTHPRHSLTNALAAYPRLTLRQQDMIRHHMFPITLVPPHTRAGWLVCYYDKVAAISDYFGKNKWKRRVHPVRTLQPT